MHACKNYKTKKIIETLVSTESRHSDKIHQSWCLFVVSNTKHTSWKSWLVNTTYMWQRIRNQLIKSKSVMYTPDTTPILLITTSLYSSSRTLSRTLVRCRQCACRRRMCRWTLFVWQLAGAELRVGATFALITWHSRGHCTHIKFVNLLIISPYIKCNAYTVLYHIYVQSTLSLKFGYLQKKFYLTDFIYFLFDTISWYSN